MKNVVCDKICDLVDTCGGHCSSNGIYCYTESIIFTVCGVNYIIMLLYLVCVHSLPLVYPWHSPTVLSAFRGL